MTRSNTLDLNPTLKDLQVLIGRWEMELSNTAFLPNPSDTAKGQISIDWLEDGAFVVIRMGEPQPGTPWALWLIHRDDAGSDYKAFYYDDRKVSRIYEMSFSNQMWKLWRQSPSFSQRFEGSLAEDGNKILAKWEKSENGKNWDHDFDVTYTRVKKGEQHGKSYL